MDDDEYVIRAFFLEEGTYCNFTVNVSEIIEENTDENKRMNIVEFLKHSGNMDFFN